MTNTLIHPHTLVFPEGIDVNTIPRRPYDFNKGDRRFHSQSAAIDHAENEAVRTGIRQIVRVDSTPHYMTLHVVQAIGS